ncbi:MAG: hypothetical protein NTV94_06665 [Planctomycetota bacterium]|nr:hypothetical protein [Planctomycetota bacterium]
MAECAGSDAASWHDAGRVQRGLFAKERAFKGTGLLAIGDRSLSIAPEELADELFADGELIGAIGGGGAPASNIAMRSAMAKAESISCVTTTLVTPSLRVRSTMS